MSKLKHIALSSFDEANPELIQLYQIFEKTLKPGMSYREFNVYYFKHRPHLLDISFLIEGGEVIGFICVSFYRHQLGARRYTICRSALGIKQAYRGGRLPNGLLCWKFMKYKCAHPGETIYLNAFVANPLIYAMICKYTHRVYPKLDIPVPLGIDQLLGQIVRGFNLRQQPLNPFVMKIHFQVHINSEDEKRIYQSSNKNVNYYLKLNPGFQQQFGVLTIVPIDWSNIGASILQVLLWSPCKKMAARFTRWATATWTARKKKLALHK